MSRPWLIAMLLLVACASQRVSPFMGDENYLAIGVDPDEQVRRIVEGLQAEGHEEAVRQRGRHFTALAFRDTDGQPSAVRVVTATGMALVVDGHPAESSTPALRVGLLPAPRSHTTDFDGDGFEEVLVTLQRGNAPACIVVYRVRDVGYVDPARIDFGPLGDAACVTAVRDVDGDGLFELVAAWSAGQLALKRAPAVEAVLFSRDHRFTLEGEEAAARYYAAQAQTTTLRLLEQRDGGDRDAAWTAAAELGLLGFLQGGAAAARVQFDEALAGLSPDPSREAWVGRVRAFLADPPPPAGSPLSR